MYTVYLHVNKINGKKYFGQTKLKLEYRWRHGKGYETQVFGRAISKYGWDNFTHIVIAENLTQDEADELESKLIYENKTYNPNYGYNVERGGFNSKVSDSTKQKLREINLGKKHSVETRNRMRKSHSKISFIAISEDGVKTQWSSLRECARNLDLNHSSISKVLRGKSKSHLGFTFEYTTKEQ